MSAPVALMRVIQPPVLIQSTSASNTPSVGCLRKRVIKIISGSLILIGAGGIGVAVYGYIFSNWAALGMGAFVAAAACPGGGCLARDKILNSLENDVTNLTQQEVILQEIVSERNQEIGDLKKIVDEYQKGLKEGKERFEALSKQNVSTTESLAKTSAELTATLEKLKSLEELEARFRTTTEKVQESLKEAVVVNTGIQEQLVKISKVSQGLTENHQEIKRDLPGLHEVSIAIEPARKDVTDIQLQFEHILRALENFIPILEGMKEQRKELIAEIGKLDLSTQTLKDLVQELKEDDHAASQIEKELEDDLKQQEQIQKIRDENTALMAELKLTTHAVTAPSSAIPVPKVHLDETE